MKYEVLLIREAENDLLDIFHFLQIHESSERAKTVLNDLELAIKDLGDHPNRGHVPPELDRVGVRAFREINFKPWRIVYQVLNQRVFIHAVLDGRRSMQQLLERRLLR